MIAVVETNRTPDTQANSLPDWLPYNASQRFALFDSYTVANADRICGALLNAQSVAVATSKCYPQYQSNRQP